MILAHIAGVPVEELLPTLAGAAAGLAILRTRLTLRVQRRRGSRR